MVISTLRGHYKAILLILALAFFGNVLINTVPTSAVTYPSIFKKGLSWPDHTGFFKGGSARNGGSVIDGGFTEAYTKYTKVAQKGDGWIVKDDASPLNARVKALLDGGGDNGIGAAYIIFTMLGKSGSEAGSSPIAKA